MASSRPEESPFPDEGDSGEDLPTDWEPEVSGAGGEAVPSGNPDELLGPAPRLQAVVDRLPESNRDLLEELFRAKFIGVRKLDKDALR
ncbi:MAG: hypothetical protein R3F07_06050 [Opitutaceae bacterium]